MTEIGTTCIMWKPIGTTSGITSNPTLTWISLWKVLTTLKILIYFDWWLTNLIQVATWSPVEIWRKIAETTIELIEESGTSLAINRINFGWTVQLLSPNGNGRHSLWKATKSLAQPQECHPPIRRNNSWARSDFEKSEMFATHLADVFKPNETEDPDDPEIDAILNQDLQLSLPIEPMSTRELGREIANLALNKAPGFNLISPRILKELPRRCFVFLTILFIPSCEPYTFLHCRKCHRW